MDELGGPAGEVVTHEVGVDLDHLIRWPVPLVLALPEPADDHDRLTLADRPGDMLAEDRQAEIPR